MSITISEELQKVIKDPKTIKVLATTDGDGNPHVVAKGSLSIDEDGRLYHLELLEGSKTNKNVTRSLWFDRPVSILLIAEDRKSYQIKAQPVKALVFGHVFEKYYVQSQERNPNNDLSTVYYYDVLEVIEQTYETRRLEEAEIHPLYEHLDRWAVN
jgi:hypothetical protein